MTGAEAARSEPRVHSERFLEGHGNQEGPTGSSCRPCLCTLWSPAPTAYSVTGTGLLCSAHHSKGHASSLKGECPSVPWSHGLQGSPGPLWSAVTPACLQGWLSGRQHSGPYVPGDSVSPLTRPPPLARAWRPGPGPCPQAHLCGAGRLPAFLSHDVL